MTGRSWYDKVPQLEVEGDRRRKLIRPGDLEVMDAWNMQNPRQVEDPNHLLYQTGCILLYGDASRGKSVLQQIRRSYIRPVYDPLGNQSF